MRLNIASRTLPITTALREFAKEQVEKFNKLHQRVSRVQIFLDQQVKGSKRDYNALVKYVVSLPGRTIVIRKTAHDMYQGIATATDRALRHVRKLKEKQIDRNRHNHHH